MASLAAASGGDPVVVRFAVPELNALAVRPEARPVRAHVEVLDAPCGPSSPGLASFLRAPPHRPRPQQHDAVGGNVKERALA